MPKQKGLTVIELTVAVVIVGIFATICIGAYQHAKYREEHNCMYHILSEDGEKWVVKNYSNETEMDFEGEFYETGKIIVSDGSKSYSFFPESIEDVCE